MTLTRTIAVLLGVLAVSLSVVVLRAESTRLQFDISKLDREAEESLGQVHEREIELARLRSPALIRARFAEQRIGEQPQAPVRAAKPAKLPPRNGRKNR